jgi:dipeptidase E
MGEGGNHSWMVDELLELYNLQWESFDVLDLASLPASELESRLADADVLYISGGNVYWLAAAIARPGVLPLVEAFAKDKVYAGVSAGSMIWSKYLNGETAAIFGESDQLDIVGGKMQTPVGYFDWYLKPHYQSAEFTPARNEAWANEAASRLDVPMYFIDDQTALKIVDDTLEVISEGKWLLLNDRKA